MKSIIHFVVVLALARSAISFAAEVDSLASAKEVEAKIKDLRAAVEKRVSTLDEEISKAAKAGVLKPSTEAYFRECMKRLQDRVGVLPDLAQIYVPPKFDTSIEIEPINLAWDNVRAELIKAGESARILETTVGTQLMERMRAVAQSKDPAKEFEAIDRLVEALRVISVSTKRTMSPYGNDAAINYVAGIAQGMKDALEAQKANDLKRLADLLQSLGSNNNSGMVVPASSRAGSWTGVVDDFKSRMLAPFDDDLRIRQQKLERAMIDRAPLPEIETALAEFTRAARELDQAESRARRFSGQPSTDRQSLSRIYGSVMNIVVGKGDATYRSSDATGDRLVATFATGEEFRKFYTDLAAKSELLKHEAEEKRQAEMKEAEQKREEEVRQRAAEKLAVTRKETQVANEKFLAAIRNAISEVTSPTDALKLADQLPSMVPVEVRGRYETSSESPLQVTPVQQELRQLAAWWRGGDTPMETPESGYYGRSGNVHAFTVEIQDLRDRASREIIAQRFGTPEIQQPPLKEQSLRSAVQALANAAAEKRDWKRAYDLLGVLSGPVAKNDSQRAAIRSFLTATNFEQADQFTEAVTGYRAVLEAVTDHTPVKEAAARLKELRQSHPEAFVAKTQRGSAVQE